MFGYVVVNKMELKFKEYYSYKGYYCGLCMTLKNKYSNVSRMTLNYDMTFLILLLSSLYEPENLIHNKRCIAHPLKKQLIIQNDITDYAAAINIILSYYNLKDNWDDEKDLKSLCLKTILKRDFTKSSEDLIIKAQKIQKYLNCINLLEKQNTCNIDEISNEFGYLMEEIILYKNDEWEKTLRKIGFYLGKYIYLLDAYEDIEEDKKNKSYNPFLNIELDKRENYAKEMLMLNVSFLSNYIEKLPLIQDKGIIDNIIYSGILTKMKKQEDKKEKINEGSI